LTLSPQVAALVVVIPADGFLRLGLPLEAVDAVTKVDDAATPQASRGIGDALSTQVSATAPPQQRR
jgi:hypothetical protein